MEESMDKFDLELNATAENYIRNIGETTLIDGGFATGLQYNVNETIDGHPLWSALFNSTNPAAVKQTHLDFLRAGAQLIRTNTYQASVEGYEKYAKMNKKQGFELIKETVRMAHLARNKFLKEKGFENSDVDIPWVVGSIGPYGAYLHNGSEYTGVYGKSVNKDMIKKFHKNRIQAIVEAGVNALAVETMPSMMEAEAITELLCDEYPDVRFWISFQCKDSSSIANGEKFGICASAIWNLIQKRNAQENLLAIGINCTNPTFITELFKSANNEIHNEEQTVRYVVYPNSGETYDTKKGTWNRPKDCQPLANYIPEWIELGVRFIGGCCRVSPDDIASIGRAIQNCNKT